MEPGNGKTLTHAPARFVRAIVAAGAALFVPQVCGQTSPAANPIPPAYLRGVSPDLRQVGFALGQRLRVAGSERMTFSGNLTKGGISRSAVLTVQLPDSGRIDLGGDGAGGPPRSLGFDGQTRWASDGTFSQDDADLMESLLEDSPETMLQRVSHGATATLFARHARISNGKTDNYQGLRVAAYQVFVAAQLAPDHIARTKLFLFDSNSHLPCSVRYSELRSDGTRTATETTRTGWTSMQEEWAPQAITRTENGKTAFTFEITGALFQPSTQDGFFSRK